MKRKLLSIFSLLFALNGAQAQCLTSSTPSNNCASFADYIDSFTLNGIAATGVNGCSSLGYGTFATPVWNLIAGSTYSFNATLGVAADNLAIWIDLNGDGSYQNTEMVWASTAPGSPITGTFTIPNTATAGSNVAMRVRCSWNHVLLNSEACTVGVGTWGETEDHLVNIIPLTPCSGVPAANSVISPTYAVCPGTNVNMTLANAYTAGGISYQWQSSTTTPIGPWTSINNATTTALTASNNVTTYYSVLVTCATGSSLQATSGTVAIGGQVVNTVPYLESFESVNYNGQLPNCSWATSAATNITQTYTLTTTLNRSPRTGAKFAAFAAGTGTNYFYTNGIQLNAGVTYSASMWYKTEYQSLINFTDLSMLIGMTQSTSGLVSVASSNGPAFNNTYKSLSSTFVVPSSGIYYLAIRATGNGGTYYLSFDDVAITAPCSINSPTLAVSGATTVCSGQNLNITVSGANSYTWSNGAHTSVVTVTPNVATTSIVNYNVVGTNTLSNCASTITKSVVVQESPQISIFMADPNHGICPGESAVLYAFGTAVNYVWSTTGVQGQNTTISPTSNTTYSVIGTNNFQCVSTQTIEVVMKTLPTVSGSSSKSMMCSGETAVLTGNGADTYTWSANSSFLTGSSVNVSPIVTTNYVVTGYEMASGCTNTMAVNVSVAACTGIEKQNAANATSVYPNPNNGSFTVELKNNAAKSIHVTDVTGRVILTANTSEETINFNISAFAAGIYYVKVQSDSNVEVVKIVKQ